LLQDQLCNEVLKCEKESEKHLNFLLRKMVSKTMVKGIMASLVICSKGIKQQNHE
jgi:hypothetical protein